MEDPRWPSDWPLVVCEDGPRAGAWYFELREHGGEHSYEAQQDRDKDGSLVGYVPTDRVVESRKYVGVVGKVMVWQPGDVSD